MKMVIITRELDYFNCIGIIYIINFKIIVIPFQFISEFQFNNNNELLMRNYEDRQISSTKENIAFKYGTKPTANRQEQQQPIENGNQFWCNHHLQREKFADINFLKQRFYRVFYIIQHFFITHKSILLMP